eukprot:gene12568-6388_t
MGKYRDGNTITIKSHDGRYISCQPSGSVVLSRDLKETEELIITKVSKKSINLKTHLDTTLHFHEDGTVEHHKVNWTETFAKIASKPMDHNVDIIKVKPHHCGFRNTYGRFIAVKENEENLTDSKFLSENAIFEIGVVELLPKVHKGNKIKNGKVYQMKTNQKMYVSMDEESHLRQHLEPSQDTSNFKFTKMEDYYVLTLRDGKYLALKEDDQTITCVDQLEQAERFEAVPSHSKIAFKGKASGKYLSNQI